MWVKGRRDGDGGECPALNPHALSAVRSAFSSRPSGRTSVFLIRAEAVARDGQSTAQTLLDRVERPRTADRSMWTSVNLIFRTIERRRRPCVGVSIANLFA